MNKLLTMTFCKQWICHFGICDIHSAKIHAAYSDVENSHSVSTHSTLSDPPLHSFTPAHVFQQQLVAWPTLQHLAACCRGVPHFEPTVLGKNKCASIITEDMICAMQLSGSGRGNSTLALFLAGICWPQLAALTLRRLKRMKNRFVRVRHRLYAWLCSLSIPSTDILEILTSCQIQHISASSKYVWLTCFEGALMSTGLTFPVTAKTFILNISKMFTDNIFNWFSTKISDLPYDYSIIKHFLVNQITSAV